MQIACHALAYLANPADRHAALYLAVTEVGTLELEAALRQLMDGACIDDAPLRALDALREEIGDTALNETVARAVAALDLYGEVCTWPDADQAHFGPARRELSKIADAKYSTAISKKIIHTSSTSSPCAVRAR